MISGKEIINIVSRKTEIPEAMMRITYGKKEIRPTKEPLKWQWKDNDQIEIKLKVLGGGTTKANDYN